MFFQGFGPAGLHSVTSSAFDVYQVFPTWGETRTWTPQGPLPLNSLRCFRDAPGAAEPPDTHRVRLPLRGSGPPDLPTAASAANPSYPAKAAGVSGDSPESRWPGGRNALTSSPRAPARHYWSTARPGLRRMFSVPEGAARANLSLSAFAPTAAPHRPPSTTGISRGSRNHEVEP